MYENMDKACYMKHGNEIVACKPNFVLFQETSTLQHENLVCEPVKKIRNVVNSFSLTSLYSLLLLICIQCSLFVHNLL